MTLTFLSALVMTSESTMAENISGFEELNINQFGLAKDNSCFNEVLYIC